MTCFHPAKLNLGGNIMSQTTHNYSYEVFQGEAPFDRYGIRAKEDGSIVAVAEPFSPDETAVAMLAKKCTDSQLSPLHLADVVSDFMTEHEAKFATL